MAAGDRESVIPLEQEVQQVVCGERRVSLDDLSRVPTGGGVLGAGDHLQTGQQQRGAESPPAHHTEAEVEDGTPDRTFAAQHGGPLDEEADQEECERKAGEYQDLRLAGVHHGRDDEREKSHVAQSVPAADHEERSREQPSGPREHGGMGPTQPAQHRSTELEDRRREHTGDRAEPQHPAQHVGAGARDDQGEDDLHREREVERKEVADEGGQAQRSRLPIEGQRHPQPFVGVPEREMALVHLRPGQCGPRDDLVRLVTRLDVVHHDAGLAQHAELRQDVVRPERRPMCEDGCEHRQRHRDEPDDARRVHPASTRACRVPRRPWRGHRHSRWRLSQIRSLPAPGAVAGQRDQEDVEAVPDHVPRPPGGDLALRRVQDHHCVCSRGI